MSHLVSAARVVPGWQWIERRDDPDVAWESMWWREALFALHDALRRHALVVGPTLARLLRYDEEGRTVTLYVETHGQEPQEPDRVWGLPAVVLATPLPRCPAGGDVLALPSP